MILLECGKWRAVVAPECGCNVTELSCDGKQILRTPENIVQLRQRPCLYGIPLLLPANRLEDGIFSFGGQCYSLPVNEPALHNHIHGLLKDAPFKILAKEPHRIVTLLENHGQLYPFPFAIEMEDTLSEDGFTRKLTLQNTGTGPMPYTLAFHTAFIEPESLCVPIKKRCEMDDRYIPTGKLLELTQQQQAYRDGMQPNGTKISGVYISCGNTVQIGDFQMTVSEQFDHWVLFNGSGNEGYLCIEPQCGAVNGLNNGSHRILPPGTRECFTLKIG